MRQKLLLCISTVPLVLFNNLGNAQVIRLGFPLEGQGPYTAEIVAVFDHSLKNNAFYSAGANQKVEAYTGEVGKTPFPRYLDGFQQDNEGTKFIVNGRYSGVHKPQFLFYDGHSGYDYRAETGTILYAPADGIVFRPSVDKVDGTPYRGTRIINGKPKEGFNTIAIYHGDGWATWYLHCDKHKQSSDAQKDDYVDELTGGTYYRIEAGQPFAKTGDQGSPGAEHLHFEVRDTVVSKEPGLEEIMKFEDIPQAVREDGNPVNPYGWQGIGQDPYTRTTNIFLWDISTDQVKWDFEFDFGKWRTRDAKMMVVGDKYKFDPNNETGLIKLGGEWKIDPGKDPGIISPILTAVNASQFNVLEISMRVNGKGEKDIGQVYFINSPNGAFTESKSVQFFKKVIKDGTQQVYKIPMAANPFWSGQITQIRIDPIKNGDPVSKSDSISIDYIQFLQNPPLLLATIGRYEDDTTNPVFYQEYNRYKENGFNKLGYPFINNERPGGFFVYKVGNIWIQDFRQPDLNQPHFGTDGETALMLNSAGTAVYLVKEKFWEWYKENNNQGFQNIGAPWENEISYDGGAKQEFDKKILLWNGKEIIVKEPDGGVGGPPPAPPGGNLPLEFVSSVEPIPNAIEIPISTNIVINFLRQMDPVLSSVGISVTPLDVGDGRAIAGQRIWSGIFTKLTFDPDNDLQYNAYYQVVAGIREEGVDKEFQWVFKTRSAIPPAPPQFTNFDPATGIATFPGGATMEFILILHGTFIMGSPESEPDRDINEGPQHQVTITQDFYMGVTEVTQGQWKSVMGTEPWLALPNIPTGGSIPAIVSWNDIQGLTQRLNIAEGAELYRLPTEAEWEYTCRAGTTTRWSFGDNASDLGNYAWYKVFEATQYPESVRQKLPNPWGLYDIHGNVMEWVQDYYWPVYPSNPQIDPTGPAGPVSPPYRVARGGDIVEYYRVTRSAARWGRYTQDSGAAGFRLARRIRPAKIFVIDALEFSPVNVGASDSLVLLITNPGEAPLAISNIVSDNQVFAASPTVLNVLGGGNAKATIVFAPTSIGGTSTNLSLTHNVADGLSIVSLSGTATDVAQPIKVSIGQVSGAISKEILVPAQIGRVVLPDTTGDDIVGAKITETKVAVNIDPTQLDFIGLNLGTDNVLTNAGHTVSFKQEPGFVTVSSTGATPLLHKGTLFLLQFQIRSGLPGEQLPINVELAELKAKTSPDPLEPGYLLSVEPIAGSVNILTLRGDIDRNGLVTAFDAILILRFLVSLEQDNPLAGPPATRDFSLATADVSGNGRVSALDAALILKFDAGLISAFPTATSKLVVSGERIITMENPKHSGETMMLPIRLSDLTDVVSGDISLTYDPLFFEVVKITPSKKLNSWQVASHAQKGRLTVALAGAKADTGAGDFFLVELRPLKDQSIVGNALTITDVILNDGAIKATIQPSIPKTYALFQNIPNPFNPETKIRFDLPQAGSVTLKVYNLAGQVIRTLVDEQRLAGHYTVIWDGTDSKGHPVASGVYFYRLTTGAFTATQKMVLMK